MLFVFYCSKSIPSLPNSTLNKLTDFVMFHIQYSTSVSTDVENSIRINVQVFVLRCPPPSVCCKVAKVATAACSLVASHGLRNKTVLPSAEWKRSAVRNTSRPNHRLIFGHFSFDYITSLTESTTFVCISINLT